MNGTCSSKKRPHYGEGGLRFGVNIKTSLKWHDQYYLREIRGLKIQDLPSKPK